MFLGGFIIHRLHWCMSLEFHSIKLCSGEILQPHRWIAMTHKIEFAYKPAHKSAPAALVITDFVLLILFPRWGRLFVTANYFVQFSKLKFNDIFTCVRWRMDSGRGEHRSSADCQWQPLLSYLTALFLRWSFTRTDYCAAWLCPPHPLLTLEKVAAAGWRMRRAD